MNVTTSISEQEAIARQIRGKLVSLSQAKRIPHLGSSLSCVDMLVALYWNTLRIDPQRPEDPHRDRFILSKGHAANVLYTTLAFRNFFPQKLLDTLAEAGGCLPEHPSPHCVPGVEVATGSLGHGLSLGAGMALAGRIQKQPYRVFVLLSDGECNEGTVWEAALFTAAQRLDHVVALVDYNKWQATGRSNEVLALSPLAEKWRAFGWETLELDGHRIPDLVNALKTVPAKPGKPLAIVANTVKGKGISFMEDDNNWHYQIPTPEQLEKAWIELGLGKP